MKPKPEEPAAQAAQAAQAKKQPLPRTEVQRPPRRKHRPRRLTRREAMEAAARLRRDAQGNLLILRFTLSQRIEHLVLLVSFTGLALTGLPQRYATTLLGDLTLRLLGGIETARQIHHLFALVFGIESIYHVVAYLYGLFMYRRVGAMWPSTDDLRHFITMIRFNLGLTDQRPKFGRYTFEEKAEYWALVWGTLLMGLTGLMQWFPTVTTKVLPGVAIPVARAVHSWEAVLAVLAILTWHFYHTVIKHFNKSIFTGYMTEEEMRHEHPAELEYLLKAVAALERAGIEPELVAQARGQGDGKERTPKAEGVRP